MKNKTIFIVDDDEAIVEALTLVLESSGYTIVSTSNGHSALKKIEEVMPNLILLDVLISGIDGRTICQKIKKNKNMAQIPVIMISAHPTAKHSISEYGAQDFLEKPFEIDDLIAKVSKYIS